MTNKQPDDKDTLLELFKKLWLPVAGFLSAVTLAYNFYTMWVGDQTTVTILTGGVGLIILFIVLAWVGFSRKTVVYPGRMPMTAPRREKDPRYSMKWRKVSWGLLIAITISLGMSGAKLFQYRQSLESKSDDHLVRHRQGSQGKLSQINCNLL